MGRYIGVKMTLSLTIPLWGKAISVDLSLVSSPDSSLAEGKGCGENPWACAEEFPRASHIAALTRSHDFLTAGTYHPHACCTSTVQAG